MIKPGGLILILMCLRLCACETKQQPVQGNVGDIFFDPAIDNPDFKVCGNRIYQYYNFGKGNFSLDKKVIRSHFASYRSVEGSENENGYLTVRFVVNCHGESGWFRVFEIDTTLRQTKFHPEIKKQLMSLTESLSGWKPGEHAGSDTKFDFYQYLTFKIRKGEITDILP